MNWKQRLQKGESSHKKLQRQRRTSNSRRKPLPIAVFGRR